MEGSRTSSVGAQWTKPCSPAPLLGHTSRAWPCHRGSWAGPWHSGDSSTSRTLLCSARGDLPAPQVTQDMAVTIQALPEDSSLKWRRCQQQSQFNQSQQTSGATICCAEFNNGLRRWSFVESPEWFFHQLWCILWNCHRYSVSCSAQDCKYLHELKHPPKTSLCIAVFPVLGTYWTA